MQHVNLRSWIFNSIVNQKEGELRRIFWNIWGNLNMGYRPFGIINFLWKNDATLCRRMSLFLEDVH
jgi:hypothetical protein